MVIRTNAGSSVVVVTFLAAIDNAAQLTGVKPTPLAV